MFCFLRLCFGTLLRLFRSHHSVLLKVNHPPPIADNLIGSEGSNSSTHVCLSPRRGSPACAELLVADGAVEDAAVRRQNTAGLELAGREAVLFSIGPGLLSSF